MAKRYSLFQILTSFKSSLTSSTAVQNNFIFYQHPVLNFYELILADLKSEICLCVRRQCAGGSFACDWLNKKSH